MAVRARTDADLDACIAIAGLVHERDGYPPYLPDGDFRALLTRPRALAAYVACDDDGTIVGHVALHVADSSKSVALAAGVLECEPAQLGVVARLFCAPSVRRRRVGKQLLHVAATGARERGLIAMLDVWTELHDAIAMYLSCGWRDLGTIDVDLPDGRTLGERVFVADPAAAR